MGLLADFQIAEEQHWHEIVDPFDPELLQPASLDLRLSRHLLTVNGNLNRTPGGWPTMDGMVIDPAVAPEPRANEEIEVSEYFDLPPGMFVLGATFERVRMPVHLAGRVEGKSSIGRLGLAIHATAGFIDPGFVGTITLELSNVNGCPIRLHPGMKICQLALLRMDAPPQAPYGSARNRNHYQQQHKPTASRAWDGFRTWPV